MQYNREEGVKEGIKEGMVRTLKELGISKEESIVKVMGKFEMQKEDATKLVELYWD